MDSTTYYVPSAPPNTRGECILEQSGLLTVGPACANNVWAAMPARNAHFHFYIYQLLLSLSINGTMGGPWEDYVLFDLNVRSSAWALRVCCTKSLGSFPILFSSLSVSLA